MANRWASKFGWPAKPKPSATRLPRDFDKLRLVTSFTFYHQSAESAHLKYSI